MSATATLNRPAKRKPAIPDAILGMGIFVFTEVMFFTGLISALLVIRGGAGESWVPPESVALPVYQTAFNTLVLILSGLFMYLAGRNFSNPEKTMSYVLRAAFMGLFFVGFQGYEWMNLIGYGMTVKSGIFSSLFYLLIGSHGVHALAGAISLFWLFYKLSKKEITKDQLTAYQMFWYLVVLVWPILYSQLYFV